MLGWPRRPEGEGSPIPQTLYFYFAPSAKKEKGKKKTFGAERPGTVDGGYTWLGTQAVWSSPKGQVIRGGGPHTLSESPTRARDQLGITYPGKEAWKGRKLADPASRATVVIGF